MRIARVVLGFAFVICAAVLVVTLFGELVGLEIFGGYPDYPAIWVDSISYFDFAVQLLVLTMALGALYLFVSMLGKALEKGNRPGDEPIPPDPTERLLTVGEVAELLDAPPKFVRRLVATDEIPFERPASGGWLYRHRAESIRFRRDEITAWLRKQG